MSLTEDLARAAIGEIGGRAEAWLSDAVDSGEALARTHLDAEEMDRVQPVFDGLRDEAPALAHLTRGALAHVLLSISVGRVTEAELEFLRRSATFEERRAASHGAAAVVYSSALARDEAWDQFAGFLARVGPVLLRAALPFLLAVL